MTDSTNPTPQDSDNNTDKKNYYVHRSWLDYVEMAGRWIVDIAAFVPVLAGAIMQQFAERGGSGARMLGFVGFAMGTLVSADNIWQFFFHGTPLFPWFVDEWIGWGGWLTIWFNLVFWIAVLISYVVQQMEARTLRSKNPLKAKKEFEEAKQYTLEKKPQGVIDLTRTLWGEYKTAGMAERKSGGLYALLFWGIDIVSAFVSRNPLSFKAPHLIIGVFFFNLLTIMAGEIGYNVWKHSKD